MWKPRRGMHAHTDQWWQDLQPGHAASGVGPAPDDEYFAGMLYLPDPSSVSRWQLHGVEKPKPEAVPRPLGFGRRG